MEGGRVAGMLNRSNLLVALTEHGQDYPVPAVMRRDFLTTNYTEMLEMAFQRLQECYCHTMPVIHEGRLAGLLTMDNLGEYFLIRPRSTRTAAAPERRPSYRDSQQAGP
jgi:CBS-domain-containing membrane protein